ncbi:MAG: orotate phosphoribosyltransferase [Oscillospiraceae bacterium]|nr:orotate phosphoribosyltransferase [Oscillospiraceae bacterium]
MCYKEAFITLMVKSGVLIFGDFITKSGRHTPYFINTGKYRTGAQMAALGDYYAACIHESGETFDLLFGPAYKGIPLAVAAATSLYRLYGTDVPYCFNRKEEKDHGEGGGLVGEEPESGWRIAIVEDVVTAGTAVRESLKLFQAIGNIHVTALYVSVDRMERGTGAKSALCELRENLGIAVYPIVTIREVIDFLHNREIDGVLYLDDDLRDKMERYLREYGAK